MSRISGKYIWIGLGLGIGVTGLVALLVKAKKGKAVPMAQFSNYQGNRNVLQNYPRGVRNNNPGNIQKTNSLWKGEIPHAQNTDQRFKQFYHYTFGIRAIIINLKAYFKKGYRCIEQIINRWAPPKENNTGAYLRHVSEYMGIPVNQTLSFTFPVIQKLVEAIIIKENGRLYLKEDDFKQAWNMVQKP